MTHPALRLAAALALGSLLLLSTACSRPAEKPGAESSSSGTATGSGTARGTGAGSGSGTGAQAGAVEAMTPADKRSLIAASFPIEVPVARGDVVRAQAQGEDAWDYELLVSADSNAVTRFYRDAYTAANWRVVKESPAGEAGWRYTLAKGDAQSEVTVEPAEQGTSRVVVVLGVGAPVLETQ